MIANGMDLLGGEEALGLFYGGQWQTSADAAVLDVIDPARAQVIAKVTDAGEGDVAAAMHAAETGFETWKEMDRDARGAALRRLASIIAERLGSLAELESAVTGRPLREMKAQMARIPEWLEYFASIASGFEAESNFLRGDFLAYTHYRPYGVCALLTPWNHPVLILVKKLAAALAAGNSVVVKPSELAPVSPLLIADWATEAGIPDGVMNVVTGAAATGQYVCSHPSVRRIDLTGGTATGRKVAASAGDRLVPCTLELGGKSPVVVFDDVDLEEAVAGALFAAFVASGQTCVSGARFLVAGSIYDAFVARFAERAAALRLGPPAETTTDVGPVISAEARDRCLHHIDTAVSEGARLISGGAPPEGLPDDCQDGYYVRPTVFADVTPEMCLFSEEVFGPVVSVTPFDGEDEALKLANRSEFALGAGIWTNRVDRAHRFAADLKAGVIWVNDHHKNDPRSVWGGFDASGYGKENGWDALKGYLQKSSVTVRTLPAFDDWFAGGSRYG